MTGAYRIFIRNLVLAVEIGIHPHEKGRRQRVRFNLEAETVRSGAHDNIGAVVSYEDLLNGLRALTDSQAFGLVETLGERILDMAMAHPGIRAVTIRIEKLDAFDDAESVGAEMSRRRDP